MSLPGISRGVRSLARNNVRHLSSINSLLEDPSGLVHGVTRENLESNPALAEYFEANFPGAFGEPSQKALDHESAKLPGNSLGEDKDKSAFAYMKKVEAVYPQNIRPLSCYLRDPNEESNSRNSRRLRRDGMIPGLLYGGNPSLGITSNQPDSKIFVKTPWRLLQRELDRYRWSFESRVYNLTILEGPDDTEGAVHRVLPQNVQRHPVKETIYCANFCRYHTLRPIKIPITYINEEESPALKRDGFIIPIQRYIECFIEDGADIPEKLELECTGLRYKEVIRLDRIIVPDGVRFSDRVIKRGDDLVVGVVHGSSRDVEAAKSTDEEEE